MYRIYCDDTLFYKSGVDDKEFHILNAKLSLEKGKVGAFTFTLPHTNKIYDNIHKLKSIITVYDNDDEIFRGRVLYDEKNFYNSKDITCEGELAFLLDSIKRPYEHKGSLSEFFIDLINNHNSQVEENKRFVVGNITVTDNNDYLSRSSEDYDNTYNVINSKLIGTYGGYLKPRKENGVRYIDYLEEYGEENDQIIEFGVNMLDIKEYITAENIFTCLIPLGAKDEATGKRLTIESVNVVDYIENNVGVELFGRIFAYNVWDDVTVATNLLNKGKAYLDANIEMSVTLTLKAVDLHLLNVNTDRIKEGDKLRVVSIPHNIDKYFECTKLEIDVLNPSNNVYTFGSTYKTLTDPKESLDDKTVVMIEEVVSKSNEEVTQEIANVKEKLTQEEIMNIITNNGNVEGVYLVDGQIWINGTYIKANTVNAEKLTTDSIKSKNYAQDVKGSFLNLADGSFDSKNLKWNAEGSFVANSVDIQTGTIGGLAINEDGVSASGTDRGYYINNDGTIEIWSNNEIYDYKVYINANDIMLEIHDKEADVLYRESLAEDGLAFFGNTLLRIALVRGNFSEGILELWGENGVRSVSNFEVKGTMSATGDITSNGTKVSLDGHTHNTLDGKPLSASGNRYGVIPFVGDDGVMEVGKYIDFHTTGDDTMDYGGGRLEANGSSLLFNNGMLARTDYFVKTTHTVSSISVEANTTSSAMTETFTKTGYLPIGIVGYRFTGDYIAYANLIQIYLSNASTGSATVTYRMRNLSTSSTISATLNVDILWLKVS